MKAGTTDYVVVIPWVAGVVLLVCLLITGLECRAEPWSVVGQTSLAVTQDNPTPNCVGLVGEICELPFVVPENTELVIKGYSIESYGVNVVLFPWITDFVYPQPGNQAATPAIRLRAALHSCLARLGTNTCPVHFVIPEGKVVNVRLLPSRALPAVHGWTLWGELRSID